MSKSALRLLAMVTVLGGAFVGTLILFGSRALSGHHRATTAAQGERAAANRAHAREAEEQAIAVASAAAERLPPPPPGSTALLPQIAAQRRFAQDVGAIESSHATRVARGQEQPREVEEAAPNPRATALTQQLQGVLVRHPEVRLAFVNCEESDCRARAQARDLATLQSFLDDPATAAAHLKVHVEAVPTAYNGTVYRADLEGQPASATPGG